MKYNEIPFGIWCMSLTPQYVDWFFYLKHQLPSTSMAMSNNQMVFGAVTSSLPSGNLT
jgi:hypothetical protein